MCTTIGVPKCARLIGRLTTSLNGALALSRCARLIGCFFLEGSRCVLRELTAGMKIRFSGELSTSQYDWGLFE